MATTIWQRNNSLFGIVPQPLDAKDFTPVAILDTDDPDQAFSWSQHKEETWQTHPTHVMRALTTQPRSTSVGDILECRTTGLCVMVASFGFTELPDWHFLEDMQADENENPTSTL